MITNYDRQCWYGATKTIDLVSDEIDRLDTRLHRLGKFTPVGDEIESKIRMLLRIREDMERNVSKICGKK